MFFSSLNLKFKKIGYKYIFIYILIHTNLYTCCVYIYIYIYICIYIYIYIYIYNVPRVLQLFRIYVIVISQQVEYTCV